MGCHSLLQEIFPTQGSNPDFQHYRPILYHLSCQGSPGNRGHPLLPKACPYYSDYPVLSFVLPSHRKPNKGSALNLPFTLFCLLLLTTLLSFPRGAAGWASPPVSRTCEDKKLCFWISPLSPLLAPFDRPQERIWKQKPRSYCSQAVLEPAAVPQVQPGRQPLTSSETGTHEHCLQPASRGRKGVNEPQP